MVSSRVEQALKALIKAKSSRALLHVFLGGFESSTSCKGPCGKPTDQLMSCLGTSPVLSFMHGDWIQPGQVRGAVWKGDAKLVLNVMQTTLFGCEFGRISIPEEGEKKA